MTTLPRVITTSITALFISSLDSSYDAMAHEMTQYVGSYNSSIGEEHTMARVTGRAEAPPMSSGDLRTDFLLDASMEQVHVQGDAVTPYMTNNFPTNQRLDHNFMLDNEWTWNKRTEATVGGGLSGDGVTSVTTKRGSVGQWILSDQLRLGASASVIETNRPESSILDYDSETVTLLPHVVSNIYGLSAKAILNPTTVVSTDVAEVNSTERPLLHSYAVGVKQFIPPCDCAVHADVARVINLGDLNTNMQSGELTGWQWTIAYLQTLWPHGHGRLAYRYAREDEFTRAYGDHLVFGADSYTAAVSHEFQKARIQGAERPLLINAALTKYVDNQSGTATTMEMGAGVKF